jgi:hypothetical protein
MSPAEYRDFALKAFEMAEEYRIEAKTSTPARAALLLRWADQRDADAWHYLDRADIDEDFNRRHAPKHERAA